MKCALLAGLLLLSGCPAPPPPESRPPAADEPSKPARVPKGCEANQSGAWVHEKTPAYRYLARDDGVTLEMALLRAASTAPDAGIADAGEPIPWAQLSLFGVIAVATTIPPPAPPSPPDFSWPEDGGVRVLLARTSNGFIGETRSYSGACAVSWPTEVFACFDGGLLIRSAARAAIDEACNSPPQATVPVMVEHRLVRLVLDGGVL
jgi:hypothetical protein